jgi:hypothetical protein
MYTKKVTINGNILEAVSHRPFSDPVLSSPLKVGGLSVQATEEPTHEVVVIPEPWPLFITGISWLRTKEDKGIGDTVKHALSYMGGTQFEWVMKRLGVDCGCGGRQEWLNAVYPYKDSSDQ